MSGILKLREQILLPVKPSPSESLNSHNIPASFSFLFLHFLCRSNGVILQKGISAVTFAGYYLTGYALGPDAGLMFNAGFF
jgi:hypothetical protein